MYCNCNFFFYKRLLSFISLVFLTRLTTPARWQMTYLAISELVKNYFVTWSIFVTILSHPCLTTSSCYSYCDVCHIHTPQTDIFLLLFIGMILSNANNKDFVFEIYNQNVSANIEQKKPLNNEEIKILNHTKYSHWANLYVSVEMKWYHYATYLT